MVLNGMQHQPNVMILAWCWALGKLLGVETRKMSLRRGSASIGSVWALPGGAAGRFARALVAATASCTPPDHVMCATDLRYQRIR